MKIKIAHNNEHRKAQIESQIKINEIIEKAQ